MLLKILGIIFVLSTLVGTLQCLKSTFNAYLSGKFH